MPGVRTQQAGRLPHATGEDVCVALISVLRAVPHRYQPKDELLS